MQYVISITKRINIKFIFILLFILLFCFFCGDNKSSDKNLNKKSDTNYIPKRIISLSPHITEFIFAIGEDKRLVGRGEYCRYPKKAKEIPVIGDALSLNKEKLLDSKPDLVLLLSYQAEHILICKKFKIKYLKVSDNRLDEIIEGYEKIENILGHKTNSEITKSLKKLKIKLEKKLQVKIKKQEIKTLVIVDHLPFELKKFFVVGNDNWMNDLILLSGGYNIYDKSLKQYPEITMEHIIKKNPDVIIDLIIGRNYSKQDMLIYKNLWKKFNTINAIKNNRIYVFHDDFYSIPGPRLLKIIENWKIIFENIKN